MRFIILMFSMILVSCTNQWNKGSNVINDNRTVISVNKNGNLK